MSFLPSKRWRHENKDRWLTIKFAVIGGTLAVLFGLALVKLGIVVGL